jgi:hypothetical protein
MLDIYLPNSNYLHRVFTDRKIKMNIAFTVENIVFYNTNYNFARFSKAVAVHSHGLYL